LSKIGLN